MPNVKLFITRTANGRYQVVVNGEGFVHAVNKKVGVRVKGDDPWFDDSLFGMGSVPEVRVLENGSFVAHAIVPRSKLNEDWEGRDEVYALADVPGYGTTRSNTIKAHF